MSSLCSGLFKFSLHAFCVCVAGFLRWRCELLALLFAGCLCLHCMLLAFALRA